MRHEHYTTDQYRLQINHETSSGNILHSLLNSEDKIYHDKTIVHVNHHRLSVNHVLHIELELEYHILIFLATCMYMPHL